MLTNMECQIDEIRRVRLTKSSLIADFIQNLNVNIHLMFFLSIILTP